MRQSGPSAAPCISSLAWPARAVISVAHCPPLVGLTRAGEEGPFTETLWRLPKTYFCVASPAGRPVSALPALANGHVTFGNFNNLAKSSEPAIGVWARILQAVPNRRLMLRARQVAEPAMRGQIQARFADRGIESDRLILKGHSDGRGAYLDDYSQVDIGLDPFPYPWVTTSIEGLWMGVHVIAHAGDRFLSRLGESVAQDLEQAFWAMHCARSKT